MRVFADSFLNSIVFNNLRQMLNHLECRTNHIVGLQISKSTRILKSLANTRIFTYKKFLEANGTSLAYSINDDNAPQGKKIDVVTKGFELKEKLL
jgi:hypothetical protein